MSPARRELLDLLAAQAGPVTISDLAGQTEQRPNTIREHLDGLVADGLAVRTRAQSTGRGRPPWQYEYTDPIGHRPGSEYAALAIALAEHIQRTSPTPAQDAVDAGETWGRSLPAQPRARSPRTRRQAVIGSLESLGFEPQVSPKVDAARLVRCPLLAAARRSPTVVCGVHQGLLRAAMEAQGLPASQIELHPFAEPGCCTISFAPPEP